MVDWTNALLVTCSTSTGSPSLNLHVPRLSCTIAPACMMNNERLQLCHRNTFLNIYSSCCSFFSSRLSLLHIAAAQSPNSAYQTHCLIRAVQRYHEHF